MAEKKTIELEVKTDSVKNLKTQLREAQEQVQILSEKFGATSREAINAAKKAAELKDAIGDAKALTDAFNPDAKFQALSSSLSGVAAGFTAYQGAMGLVGVESKELERQLLKVQSAMALSQGLQQLGEARDSFLQLGAVVKTKVVGAFSTLKGAIISTGIGLLVIAIGALIANFDKLKNVVSENTANAQKFVDSTRAEGEAARATANDFAEYERTLKRLGYTEDEIRSKRGDKLKDAIADTEKEIEANKKLYKEQLANLETVYKYDKLGLNATGRALYGSEEDAAATRENITKLRKELEKFKNDLFEFEEKQKNGEKEKTNVIKKNVKEQKDAVKDLSEENYQKYLRDKEMRESEMAADAAVYEYFAELDRKAAEEKEALRQQELADEQLAADMLEKIRLKQLADERDAIAQKKLLRQQEFNAVQDTFTTIANLAELFSGKTRKQQKAAFQVQKAANIANATMDTYKAATSAYASLSGVPVVGPALGAAAAGVAVSAGLLNVKRIASQQFESTSASSGGSGGGSVPSTSPSTQGGVIAPTFNVNSGTTNQLNTLQQQPIQAYVVSGQVTSAQALDRNRIKNATL